MIDTQAMSHFLSTTAVEVGIKILAAIVFWFVGRWLIRTVTDLIRAAMNRSHIDPTLTKYLGSIVARDAQHRARPRHPRLLRHPDDVVRRADRRRRTRNRRRVERHARQLRGRRIHAGAAPVQSRRLRRHRRRRRYGSRTRLVRHHDHHAGQRDDHPRQRQDLRRDDSELLRIAGASRRPHGATRRRRGSAGCDRALQGGGRVNSQRGDRTRARSRPARHQSRRPGDRGASVHAHRPLLAGVFRHERDDRARIRRSRLAGAEPAAFRRKSVHARN